MSRAEARFTHLAVAASGITGLVYGWLRYFVEPLDEFALVNHPAEPWWKGMHILLVPLLLMAFGLVFRRSAHGPRIEWHPARHRHPPSPQVRL